jgi:putative ABC transport system ATP-binding protein
MTQLQAVDTTENTTASTNSVVIEGRDLVKVYRRGVEEVRAVDGISFTVREGEFVAVVGPSGAGKTTLLQLIGAMDVPTSGSLRLMGRELRGLPDRELTRLRRDHIGFVFQHFGLLPTLTVAENVALPGSFGGRKKGRQVGELLERVGLAHRKDHRPAQLSGGEMQRVAIARALVNSPQLLLADEPTGNLDSATSGRIVDLLLSLNADGLTVVVVTHNEALAASAQRSLCLRDGRVEEE